MKITLEGTLDRFVYEGLSQALGCCLYFYLYHGNVI